MHNLYFWDRAAMNGLRLVIKKNVANTAVTTTKQYIFDDVELCVLQGN